MSKRTGRSPMDRAADGLTKMGEAAVASYNAAAQVLPEAMRRADQALELAERGVSALERIADAKLADDQQYPPKGG